MRRDIVARLGGDEFAFVQVAIQRVEETELLAERIIRSLGRLYSMESNQIRIGASVGVALAPADGLPLEVLVSEADKALYRSKSVRNRFSFASATNAPDAMAS